MKRRAVTRLLVAGAMALPIAAGPVQAAMSDDEAAILAIWETYSAARVNADFDSWFSLWDEGGIKMSQGKAAVGYDMFPTKVAPKFKPGSVATMQIDADEIVVTGDWAYCRGTYTSDRLVGGEMVHLVGDFLTILKRQPDGGWKIFRDMATSISQ